MPEREIWVTDHAVYQFSARRNDERKLHEAVRALKDREITRADLTPEEYNYFRQIRHEIVGIVRRGITERRTLNHKPKGFVLFGRKKSSNQLPPSQRFIWGDDDSYGFIISREGERDIVITTINRTGARYVGEVVKDVDPA